MENKVGLAERLFCIGFFSLCGYLLLKYAIGAVLPFVFAYLISLAISPLAVLISKKMKLPIKLCTAILVILSVVLVGYLVYIGVLRLKGELELLMERLQNGSGELSDLIERVGAGAKNIFSEFQFLNKTGESSVLGSASDIIEKIFSSVREGIISFLGSKIPAALAQTASKAPQSFIGFFVTLMASYYFVAEKERIKDGLQRLIPTSIQGSAQKYISKISYALRRYARGYLLLMLLTFSLSFIGLGILKVKYSFIIALVIAVIDILPILGSGTVLLPWAIVELLVKNTALGTGLLVLYGVMTIIRQISEPKIIGDSIGLHPMVSLFSTYVGLRLFGIWGMILSPAVALIIKEMTLNKTSDSSAFC